MAPAARSVDLHHECLSVNLVFSAISPRRRGAAASRVEILFVSQPRCSPRRWGLADFHKNERREKASAAVGLQRRQHFCGITHARDGMVSAHRGKFDRAEIGARIPGKKLRLEDDVARRLVGVWAS